MSQDPNADYRPGGRPDRPDSEQPYGVPPPPPDPYTSPDFYGVPPSLPPDPYSAPGTPPPPYPYADLPPVPGYGAPQHEYGSAYGAERGVEEPSTPLPLGEAIRQLPRQYIRVATNPSAQTFAAEMGKSAWNIIWVQLIGYAIIATALSFLSTLINPVARSSMTNGSTLPPGVVEAITLGASIGSLVLVPLSFFLLQGITYLIARAFNGSGTFVRQGYTTLLIQVPLGIISGFLGLIPILGLLVAIAASVYEIVLSVFSIMAVHRLSGGKATGVVLIPIAILFVLGCVLAFVFVVLVGMAARYR